MSNAPGIRFNGFTDAWEQRKFIYLVDRVSKSNNDDTLPRVEFEDIISGLGQLNKDISKKHSFKSGIEFENGDVLFGKLRPYLKNWLLPDFKGVAVGDFWVLRPNKNSNIYIYYLIQSDNFQVAANLSTGTKMPRSDWNVVSGTELYTPSVSEQTAIGNFFRTLDDIIALYKRKLDGLRKLKKAYLQVMFPESGGIMPKLRFKGFTEPWDQHKLEHYFNERSERSGGDELISVTINSGVKKASELDRQIISSEDKSNYKTVKVGDIAYNSMRMWQGASGYSPYNGILSPAYTVITPNKNAYSQFFAYLFKRKSMIQIFQRNSQGLTSDTWNLKFPAFSQIETHVPSMDEQKMIYSFINSFDINIEALNHKLEKLNRLKSAYLKKMFV